MLGYNEVLRQFGSGKFRDLLRAVCKQGALIAYLDANTSTKVHPNENFARELLELFTMGIGNYTEKDVQEAARAFTGWSIHYGGLGDETPYEKQADIAAHKKMSILNFCFVPAHHDEDSKTILGKTANFTGDEVIDLLASRIETMKFICTKLWVFFAGSQPSPDITAALVSAWKASDGEIRAILKAITERSEYWSEKCVRSIPKSPLDFSVALFRNLGVDPLLFQLLGEPPKEFEPIKEDLRKAGQGILYLMAQQGMTLLFPPNVGGWEWGSGWITANNTIARVNHSSILFWGEDKSRPLTMLLVAKLKGSVNSSAQIVDAVVDVFDADVDPVDRDVLIEACTRAGGIQALAEKDAASNLFASLTKLIFAMPSYQLC